jgi:hypothetical protein
LVVKSEFVAAQTRKMPAPPLGIIASLASGFETVNARLELILLPLALDLFLWLGPHLSIRPVTDQIVAGLPTPPGVDAATADNFEAMREALVALFTNFAGPERFNFFSTLSTMPLGLPSLMAGRAPLLLPGGAPLIWPVGGALDYVLLRLGLSLLGLFLGALYFGSIAQQIRDAQLRWRVLWREVWGDWARLTALAAVAILGLALLSIPLSLFALVLAFVHPLAARFAVSTVMLWLLIYFGFTLHGLVVQRRGLLGAMWDSVRLAHVSLAQTLTLYTAVVCIYIGLDWVWNLPADDAWLLLIGLVGHAVVATALVAATFVFYKDRYRWWMEIRQMALAQVQAGRDGANRSTKA